MREKRRQKKGENESERVAGERRRERFAGYNRKAQLTHKYHLPGLAHLRVRERERERERLFLASRAGSMPMFILTSFVLVWPW